MMVTHREEPIPPRSIPRLQYRKRLVHPPRASLFPFFRTGVSHKPSGPAITSRWASTSSLCSQKSVMSC